MTLETARPIDAGGRADGTPIRVIFIGTGNAGRSQMAEALLRKEGKGGFDVVRAFVPLALAVAES